MDPLENLCVVKDFFTERVSRFAEIKKYSRKEELQVVSPRSRRNKMLLNEGKLEILKIPQVSKSISIEGFFKYHSSYVLANIDTIYNFSNQENGYLIPQVINEDYKYVILDSDIGFLEYLQYRLPESVGFTNCDVGGKSKFPNNKINTNCDNGIVKYVNDIAVEGVDLVVSNTIDYIGNSEKALQICKKGGTFIGKVYEVDLQLLYILTLCFKNFSLFRPFLENENVVYVICEGYTGNFLDIIPLFLEKHKIIVDKDFINYISDFLSFKVESNHTYNLYRCKSLMNVE